jgi:tRNA A-37 threonylcarbamoyl transferase component Bud32
MHYCSSCGTRFTNEMRFCPHDGQPLQEVTDQKEVPIDPLVGTVIDGRYLIESVLGEGGMGVVYLATHTALNKRFAVKVLRGEIARDEEIMRRFVREAQSSTAIGHANIVDISDFGKLDDGTAYFVMEHLEGEPLTDRIRRGAMPTDEVLHVASQIAAALAAAHGRGIIHRDLKPDNIFLIRRGGDDRFVKILDFGIAKVGGANAKLTRTGMIFGTPHYMSPEQAAGQSVDPRTDVYALGVILFEMLTGEVPFDGDTFMGILGKHMFDPPPKPSELVGDLGAIEPLVLESLAKKPEDRYPSMDELLADIDRLRAGEEVSAPTSAAATPPSDFGDYGTAGEPVVTPQSRLPVLLVGAFIVLLGIGGGVGAWLALQDGENAPSATSLASEEPALAASEGAQPAIEETTEAPEVPAEPEAIDEADPFVLASDPAGALVLLEGAIIGNTPLEIERPTEGQLLLEVRSRGFETQAVSLTPGSPERLDIVLEPEVAASPMRRRRRRAPTMESSPTESSPTETPSMETPSPMTTMMSPNVPSEVVDPWAL